MFEVLLVAGQIGAATPSAPPHPEKWVIIYQLTHRQHTAPSKFSSYDDCMEVARTAISAGVADYPGEELRWAGCFKE